MANMNYVELHYPYGISVIGESLKETPRQERKRPSLGLRSFDVPCPTGLFQNSGGRSDKVSELEPVGRIIDGIQPIETRWQGYRFRSRLEARWAVYFEAMKIPWDYEPEGFDLGDLGWYLPDFQLYGKSIYAEVKPAGRDHEEVRRKMERLASGMQVNAILLDGPPEIRSYPALEPVGDKHHLDCWWDEWVLCNYRSEGRPWHGASPTDAANLFEHELYAGVVAARAARFEHGETP